MDVSTAPNHPRKYGRPPNVETAIELVFSQHSSANAIEKASRRLSRYYENVSQENNLNYLVDVQREEIKTEKKPLGWRLTSRDQTEVLVLHNDRIIVGQLAPYSGWDMFSERVRRDYDVLKSEVGFRLPTRVGVRSINRIDVPSEDYSSAGPSQFLKFAPYALPYGNRKIDAFVLLVENGLDTSGSKAKVTLATVFPLVPGTTALLLDIDVFNDSNLPDSDAGIWQLAEKLRNYKNEIFETSITDHSRELFV